MKFRILLGCFLTASMTLVSSCSDFLTEDPKGKLTPDTFFSNQNELDMSVYALYAKVQDFQADSNPLIVQCQGSDVTSTTGGNKAAYLSADAFEVPSDAKGLEFNWKDLYAIIKAANLIIMNAGDANTTQAEINIAMGQAYYWRAFSYFNLVRNFGPLPMNLENKLDNNATTLTPVADVYAQIVSDLQEAEKCNLPAKYTEANRSINGVNIYVSEQTVKATLAAVYMAMAGYPMNQTNYYATAADKAKEVIDGVNSGKYGHALLNDWNEVFSYGNNHHNETLLGIDYNSRFGGWAASDSQLSSCHQSGKLQGWGDFLAERHYWAGYPEGPRKDAVYAKQIRLTSGEMIDWWATTDGEAYNGENAAFADYRPMFVAFTVNKDEVTGLPMEAPYDCTLPFWSGMCINKRHQLIRYSEVLCWYAEAAARAGKDLASAKAALKQVRARAYADEAAIAAVDNMSADQLAEAAYEEHGYEVAGYVVALVTRRADEFRMERLKAHYDYRAGEQKSVLVPAGTLTHSVDAEGKPFTYTLKQDVVVAENMPITAAWAGEASIYHNYPPTEVEKNPNLRR